MYEMLTFFFQVLVLEIWNASYVPQKSGTNSIYFRNKSNVMEYLAGYNLMCLFSQLRNVFKGLCYPFKLNVCRILMERIE